MNAFELFDLPISMDIDLVQLRKVYIQKQQSAHPDHGGELIDSERINEAYAMLKNRDRRVRLILELAGINTNDSSTLPKGFLFEMMEISESLEVASPESIREKVLELLDISDLEFKKMSETFNNSNEDIAKLAVWYQKNKYYNRLSKNSQGIQEI